MSTGPVELLSALARGDAQVFQSDQERRTELLADLVAAAWGTHGEFIDADQFLTKPTVLRRLAGILASRVPAEVDRLIGREPHSLVLGAALALETGLPLVVLRVADSPAGPELRCFGELHPGERVLLVEGVTGTGTSAAQAVAVVRARGAEVAGVLVAVDRGVGASERLSGLGLELDTLFEDSELRSAATRGLETR
jgi:orotate phosphoribosyltransferase